MITPKEKADQLVNQFGEHAQYWDCYNDAPLEEAHDVKSALICANENFVTVCGFSVHAQPAYLNHTVQFWMEVKRILEERLHSK